jgi:general nucleoside transport system ATP-binding protein
MTANVPAALEGRDVAHRYGERSVLHGVSFALMPGRIHAVLGENGAGKSTLLKVLAGVERLQAGAVWASGSEIRRPSVRAMRERGVAMVQQHFALQASMTGMENLQLSLCEGPLVSSAPFLSRLRALEQRLGVRIVFDRPAGELSLGEQQQLEIVRALLLGGKVLILDEPTAVLTPNEAASLYRSLRSLAEEGAAICVVTHRLDEVISHADDVSILRKGNAVPAPSERTREALTLAMMGSLVSKSAIEKAAEERRTTERVLELRNVSDARLRQVSLTVHAGEIVGVAGIDGNGQHELVQVASRRAQPWSGTVSLRGDAALVPEDRQQEGLVLDASVADNLLLGRHTQHRAQDTMQVAGEIMKRIEPAIRCGQPARELSGGNQQKVVVARAIDALLRGARACVVSNPTRGVDVHASATIHTALRGAATRGAGILVVSADLDELRALADRILVLKGGSLSGPFAPDSAEIAEAML